MHNNLKVLVSAIGLAFATCASAQVTFYSGEGFRGRAFGVQGEIDDFAKTGFNDMASSVVVDHGRWEVCENADFRGRCTVLRPGSYPSLSSMGMDNRISSIRPVSRPVSAQAEMQPPLAAPTYEYRQRPDERLYDAPVKSVRAVVGPPEQRCWVDRQVVEDHSHANVPGVIVGGILGGILGHQIGGGRGQDVATVGGAVAGAAVGSQVNRGSGTYTQDVQRCATVPSSARADFYDVTYDFRGVEHHVQLSAPPGPTISVNGDGEPRG